MSYESEMRLKHIKDCVLSIIASVYVPFSIWMTYYLGGGDFVRQPSLGITWLLSSMTAGGLLASGIVDYFNYLKYVKR